MVCNDAMYNTYYSWHYYETVWGVLNDVLKYTTKQVERLKLKWSSSLLH